MGSSASCDVDDSICTSSDLFPSIFKISPLAYNNNALKSNLISEEKNFLNLDLDKSFILDLFCHYKMLTTENEQKNALKNIIIPLFCHNKFKSSKKDIIEILTTSKINLQFQISASNNFFERYVGSNDSKTFVQSSKKKLDAISKINLDKDDFIKKYLKDKNLLIFFSDLFSIDFAETLRDILKQKSSSDFIAAAINYSFEAGDSSTLLLAISCAIKNECSFKVYPQLLENPKRYPGISFSVQNLTGGMTLYGSFKGLTGSRFTATNDILWVVISNTELLCIDISEDVENESQRMYKIQVPKKDHFSEPPFICTAMGMVFLYVYYQNPILLHPKNSQKFKVLNINKYVGNIFTSDGNFIYSIRSVSQIYTFRIEGDNIIQDRTINLKPPLNCPITDNLSIISNGITIQIIKSEKADKKKEFVHTFWIYSIVTGELINGLDNTFNLTLKHRTDAACYVPQSRTAWAFASNKESLQFTRYKYSGPDSPAVTGFEVEPIHCTPFSRPWFMKFKHFALEILRFLDLLIFPEIGNRTKINESDNPFSCRGADSVIKAIENVNSSKVNQQFKDQFLKTSLGCLSVLAQAHHFSLQESKVICKFFSAQNPTTIIIYTIASIIPALNNYSVHIEMLDLFDKAKRMQQEYITNEILTSHTIFSGYPIPYLESIVVNIDKESPFKVHLLSTLVRVVFRELFENFDLTAASLASAITSYVLERITTESLYNLPNSKSKTYKFLEYFLLYSKFGLKSIEFTTYYLEILQKTLSQTILFIKQENIMWNEDLEKIFSMIFSNVFLGLKDVSLLKMEKCFALIASDSAPTKKIGECDFPVEDIYKLKKIMIKTDKEINQIALSAYRAFCHQLNVKEKPITEKAPESEELKEVRNQQIQIVTALYSVITMIYKKRQEKNKYEKDSPEYQKVVNEYEHMKEMVLEKAEYMCSITSSISLSKENIEILKSFLTSKQTIEETKAEIVEYGIKKRAVNKSIKLMVNLFSYYISSCPLVIPFIGRLVEEGVFQRIIDLWKYSKDNYSFKNLRKLYELLSLKKYYCHPYIFSIRAYLVVEALEFFDETKDQEIPDNLKMMSNFFVQVFSSKHNDIEIGSAKETIEAEKIIVCCIQSLYMKKYPNVDRKWMIEENANVKHKMKLVDNTALMIAGLMPERVLSIWTVFNVMSSFHLSITYVRELIKTMNDVDARGDIINIINSLGSVLCGKPDVLLEDLKCYRKPELHNQISIEIAELLRLLLTERSITRTIFNEILKEFIEKNDLKNLNFIIGVLFVLSNTVVAKTSHELGINNGQLNVNINGDTFTSVPVTSNSIAERSELQSELHKPLLPFMPSQFPPSDELIEVLRSIFNEDKYKEIPLLRFLALRSIHEYINDPNFSEAFTTKMIENLRIYDIEYNFNDSLKLFNNLIDYCISAGNMLGKSQPPPKPKLVYLKTKYFSDKFDYELSDDSISTGRFTYVFMSTLLPTNKTVKMTVSKEKNLQNVYFGLFVHSPEKSLTRAVYYSSLKGAILANGQNIADVRSVVDSITFEYSKHENKVRIIDGNGFEIQVLESPDGPASFFLVIGRHVKIDYSIDVEEGNEESYGERFQLCIPTKTFINSQEILVKGNGEIPDIVSVSFTGSVRPIEVDDVGLLPVIHIDDYENIPHDVVNAIAMDTVSIIEEQVKTEMISAALRCQLEQTIDNLELDFYKLVEFVLSVALNVETFRFSKSQTSIPFDLENTVFDKDYQCTKSDQLENLESARILYNFLIEYKPEDFIRELMNVMDTKFNDNTMHFATKSNTYARVITGMGPMEVKPGTIIIISQFLNDETFKFNDRLDVKYYATEVEGKINVDEKDTPIIALQTSKDSNSYAFGTFLELGIYIKYIVLLTERLSKFLSEDVQAEVSHNILLNLWHSILEKSPLFYVHSEQWISFVDQHITNWSRAVNLFTEIRTKIDHRDSFLIKYCNEKKVELQMEFNSTLKLFYPELSGSSHTPDLSTFQVPDSPLEKENIDIRLIKKVLRPVNDIKHVPIHLILKEWEKMIMAIPPITVEKIKEQKNQFSIHFNTVVPKIFKLTRIPISINYKGIFLNINEQGEFINIDRHNDLIVTFDKATLPSDIVVLSEEVVPKFSVEHRPMFISDIEQWIEFSQTDDMKILNAIEQSIHNHYDDDNFVFLSQLNELSYPLHLLVLRAIFLSSFNELISSIKDISEIDEFNEVSRFISMKRLSSELKTLMASNSFNSPVPVKVDREKSNMFRDGLNNNFNWSAFGQFDGAIKDPSILRVAGQPMQVEFIGEDGVDCSGLLKSFISMIIKDIENPKLGLFTLIPNAVNKLGKQRDRIVPVPNQNNDKKHAYQSVGALIGMLIRYEVPQPFSFPQLFWNYMANGTLTQEDIFDIDDVFKDRIDHIRKSASIMTNGQFDNSLCLENTIKNVLGEECILGGIRHRVPRLNAMRFTVEAVNFRIQELERPLGWIRDGFWESFGFECPKFVTPFLLEKLACTEKIISMPDLYSRIMIPDPDRQYFKDWLVEILSEYDNDMVVKFLEFAIGQSVLPVNSGGHNIAIFINNEKNPEELPQVHTCFNALDIPNYPSVDVFRDKLEKAILYVGNEGYQIA